MVGEKVDARTLVCAVMHLHRKIWDLGWIGTLDVQKYEIFGLGFFCEKFLDFWVGIFWDLSVPNITFFFGYKRPCVAYFLLNKNF
jgi:hypothetical protein